MSWLQVEGNPPPPSPVVNIACERAQTLTTTYLSSKFYPPVKRQHTTGKNVAHLCDQQSSLVWFDKIYPINTDNLYTISWLTTSLWPLYGSLSV